jgi:hypothetical protein
MSKRKILKKKDLTEFVDDKGGKIQGDEQIDQVGISTASHDTTDDAAHTKSGVQSSRYNPRISWMSDEEEPNDETLDKVSKDKMKGVLEDILSKRKFDKDVIDKVKYSNGIPDIGELKDAHPVLVRKISHMKTLLDRDDIGGDEKAILINSLLSSDLTDIPSQYKRELSRKLGY